MRGSERGRLGRHSFMIDRLACSSARLPVRPWRHRPTGDGTATVDGVEYRVRVTSLLQGKPGSGSGSGSSAQGSVFADEATRPDGALVNKFSVQKFKFEVHGLDVDNEFIELSDIRRGPMLHGKYATGGEGGEGGEGGGLELCKLVNLKDEDQRLHQQVGRWVGRLATHWFADQCTLQRSLNIPTSPQLHVRLFALRAGVMTKKQCTAPTTGMPTGFPGHPCGAVGRPGRRVPGRGRRHYRGRRDRVRKRRLRGSRRGPFNFTPMGVNSISFGSPRTYNAPPWGVRVASQTKSGKIPTRKTLPLFFETRTVRKTPWCRGP